MKHTTLILLALSILLLGASLGSGARGRPAVQTVPLSERLFVEGLSRSAQALSPDNTCNNPLPISCGDTAAGNTENGSSIKYSYLSCVGWDESGPEEIYAFELPDYGTPWDVSASLSNLEGIDLDVFFLQPCEGDTCLDHGNNVATMHERPPGLYYLSVDGYAGAAGPYSLSLGCAQVTTVGLCTSPIPLSCGETVEGDTTGGGNLHIAYPPCEDWPETGPERIYAISLPDVGDWEVTATLIEIASGQELDLFFLEPLQCDEGTCLSSGDDSVTATLDGSDDNLLVVDGRDGAAGSYTLQLTCAHAGDTFVVNSILDGGQAVDDNPGDGLCRDMTQNCSLRAAIMEANGKPGADTIIFDTFYFQYPSTITLTSELPPLAEAVTIDASSVWDTESDLPRVTLTGGSFCGLSLAADACEVYGLQITSLEDGICVQSAHNRIGGPGSGQRNVLSGNGFNGVLIAGAAAHDNLVQGNYIGINPAGNAGLQNYYGVHISSGAYDNTIGGSTAAEGNVISGNDYGVLIRGPGSNGNRLGGNMIGPAADGVTFVGNQMMGVYIDTEAASAQIGTGQWLAANTIAQNTGAGVSISNAGAGTSLEGNIVRANGWRGINISNTAGCWVAGNTIADNSDSGVTVENAGAIGNEITANSIYGHDGASGYKGIELRTGGNNGLAAPTITAASETGASGTACSRCRVEVFSDEDDEGKIYHGYADASSSGAWVYSGALAGPYITATNTDASGNTSEFSTPRPVSGFRTYLPVVTRAR